VAVSEIGSAVPEAAVAVRDGLGVLYRRLCGVHEFCAEIDDQTWTGYLTGLDRSLAELATDIASAPADTAACAADLVYARSGRMEVDGWALRLDLAGREAPTEGRELVAGAVAELDTYRIAVTKGDAPSRADVERALNELRGAVA
jgi:hypothetical protein